MLRFGLAVDGLCSIELGDVRGSTLQFLLGLSESVNPVDDLQMVRTLGAKPCLHPRHRAEYDYESLWLLFLQLDLRTNGVE